MSNKSYKSIIAGSLAGSAEAILTWPTENIKTQMQFKESNKGFIDTSRSIYQKNGFAGFYRGLTPVLSFNIPKVASRFYSFDISKKYLESKNIKGNMATISSGLFAGFVESTLVTVPSETIKTKQIKENITIKEVIKKGGLYQGYTATLGRQSLNQASRFLFYQHYKDYVIKKEGTFSNYNSFMGGIGAGIFSVGISTPMDVLKTQMQESKKEKIIDLSKTIYEKYGLKGFWRGSVARLIRVAPGQGVMFLTYDGINKLLDNII